MFGRKHRLQSQARRNSSRSRRHWARPTVEPLEDRALPSASVMNGVLTILGSDAGDTLRVLSGANCILDTASASDKRAGPIVLELACTGTNVREGDHGVAVFLASK